MEVLTTVERGRGCGFRSEGFYLRGEFAPRICGILPLRLDVCPCCGEGMRQVRGWRKIDLRALSPERNCINDRVPNPRPRGIIRSMASQKAECARCPFGGSTPEEAYLLWVGMKHYSPASFSMEAETMGVSKRIPQTRNGNPSIPKGFLIGESLVVFAHPEACVEEGTDVPVPGIFTAFTPSHIEYVVDSSRLEDPEYLEYLNGLSLQGVTLIKVMVDRSPTNGDISRNNTVTEYGNIDPQLDLF